MGLNWREEFLFWWETERDGPRWKRELRFWFWYATILLYLLLMVICFVAAHEAMNLGL